MDILIFGATENIYEIAKKELNMDTVNIAAFVDNDSYKQGFNMDGIPIISMDEICTITFDYILIGAWFSYEVVKDQLLSIGVLQEKIYPLYVAGLYNYYIGETGVLKEDVLLELYVHGQEVKRQMEYVNELYHSYQSVPLYVGKRDGWIYSSSLVSHACGGLVNGKKRAYSNSKEALEYSLKKQFKLIECDIWGIQNQELVLAHNYNDIISAEQDGYTIQTMKDVLNTMVDYPDVFLMVDVKWNLPDDYYRVVDLIEHLIKEIERSNLGVALKNQIILEVYNPETIEYARTRGFECIYTQYRNPNWKCFMNTVIECGKWNVGAVALRVNMVKEMSKYLYLFKEKNIKVFCFSTDSVDEYAELRKLGVDSVFTNYL